MASDSGQSGIEDNHQKKLMKELLYLKRIEETVQNSAEQRINKRSQSVRDEIEKLSAGVLDEKYLKSVRRLETIDDLEESKLVIDEEHVQGYRKLVQYELRQQMKTIATIGTKAETEEEIRSLYGKANFLIDFVVSHIQLPHGVKEFTKSSLLKQVQSEKGAELIRKLYTEISRSLESGDTDESERIIQEMSTTLQVHSMLDRQEHIQEILSTYAPEIEISSKEIDIICSSRRLDTGEASYFSDPTGMSYHETLARSLQNIETLRYEMALNRMLPLELRDKNTINEYLDQIGQEVKSIKQSVQKFRTEYYTADRLIDEQSSGLSAHDKDTLKRSIKAIANLPGVNSKALQLRLAGAQSKADYQVLQDYCDQQMLSHLSENGVTEDQINSFKKSDPLFRLPVFYKKWQKEGSDMEHENSKKESSGEEEKGPVISDTEVLRELRGYLQELQEIADRDFSEDNDQDLFEKITKKLQKFYKKQTFPIHEGVDDENGKPLYEGTVRVTKIRQAQQDIPALERQQLNSLNRLWDHQKRYAHLQELKKNNFTEINYSLENPKNIRDALEALFGGFNSIKIGHTQLRRLSKVMSLEHPLTAVRMHYAKKKPFDGGQGFEMHRVPGNDKPATFLERSKLLIQRAQILIKEGNMTELERLFEHGQMADQLYLDSAFFPLKTLKNAQETRACLFEKEFEEDQVRWVPRKKIRGSQDKRFFEDQFKKFEGPEGTFDSEHDLEELSDVSNVLMDEGAFQLTFASDDQQRIAAIADHADSLVFNPDGSLNEEASQANFQGIQDYMMQNAGACKGLGMPAGTKLRKEKLVEIAKDYPLLAGRMAQFNSMLVGGGVAGLEKGLQYGVMAGKFGIQYPTEVMGDFWKKLDWYSPQHIWMAVDQMIEHISGLADFRVKIGSYSLLQNVFAGTLVGNEFAKLYQGEEDRRVGEFKDAFGDFGHSQVINKIYTASDQFELKAALLEGLENRGIITLEDMLNNDFFRQLNKYTKNINIPLNYSDQEMAENEEIRFEMVGYLRGAIDDIWGDGTWQSWRSASASKYESSRKSAEDEFGDNDSVEKKRWFDLFWEKLRSEKGIAELKQKHPGEIVGYIEQDMKEGMNDSGVTFTLMQAMISKGIVKAEHARRLELAHSNDLPIYALLKPEQARLAGLTGHIDEVLSSGKSLSDNKVHDFFQGKKALELEATYYGGKWSFPKSQMAFNKAKKDKKIQKASLMVHQLQKNREAQPEFHRKMDNSCIGIFSTSYTWSQIENALRPDTNGNIDARPHDIVAAYRGIHHEFIGYMESLRTPEVKNNPVAFKRAVWYAYAALSKTQAYASFLSRQVGRTNDVNTNPDGSPNFESKYKETRATSGTSNFEKLILDQEGGQQRMNESSDHIDAASGINENMRVAFKTMAGMQYAEGLGFDTESGMRGGKSTVYDSKKFNPAKHWKEAMKAFEANVLESAAATSFADEIRTSLQTSKMTDFSVGNTERQSALSAWKSNEAKL